MNDANYQTVRQFAPNQYEQIVAFCSVFGPLDFDIKYRAQVEKFIMQQVAKTISDTF